MMSQMQIRQVPLPLRKMQKGVFYADFTMLYAMRFTSSRREFCLFV